MNVLTCNEINLNMLRKLLGRFGAGLTLVPNEESMPGSWFGDPEAGLIGRTVLVRGDTPVHSALHESCHLICMDPQRRKTLHTDAGGDYDEENAVNYLQILLADFLPEVGRDRMMADMDAWGYTYRLGSARRWFREDAADAREWLLREQLITAADLPTWRLRGESCPVEAAAVAG